MPSFARIAIATALLSASASSMAWWGNRGWHGWNDWPVWTPMYWAEEFFEDDDWYGPYGYDPYHGGYGGYPYYGGYGYSPYGYAYPGYHRPYGW